MGEGRMFPGKVALITGAASGIGRAVALAFAREGAKLAITDLDEAGLAGVSEEIRQAGAEVWSAAANITQAADVQRFVGGAADRFGRIDCAVNNAGIRAAVKPLADYSEAEFDQMMAINFRGVWLCMKYEIPEMLKGGGGAIVNLASGAGLLAVPNNGTYVASKHGVIGLTRAGAVDYASAGIRINAICPGYTRTPMALGSIEDTEGFDLATAAAAHPIGRIAEPEEQADAVLYLCSDKASFIVGHALLVDGGYSVQ